VVSNIFMEHFEELALRTAIHRPSLWLWYVDDTFVIWPHGPDKLQFFDHINSIRPSIQFTMQTEVDNKIPFLDVLVIRKQSAITTTVYRKPSHTGRYLNFHLNRPPHVRRGAIRSLYRRATIVCEEPTPISSYGHAILQFTSSHRFTETVILTLPFHIQLGLTSSLVQSCFAVYILRHVTRVITSTRVRCVGHAAHMSREKRIQGFSREGWREDTTWKTKT
jgi:hypothetical protein